LQALALSIQEVGILQPIVVRRSGSGYELIAGERRLRAAKLAGLATVPVILRESDDSESLREALIENIHRENLNPIELAEAFRELLEELGLKQETLAERLGVSRSHVANTIRLLQLPAEVQGLLAEGKIQAGHGRALLSLADAEAQRALGLRAAAEELSVREVEELVRNYLEHPAAARQEKPKEPSSPSGPRSSRWRRSCPSSWRRGCRSRWARSEAAWSSSSARRTTSSASSPRSWAPAPGSRPTDPRSGR